VSWRIFQFHFRQIRLKAGLKTRRDLLCGTCSDVLWADPYKRTALEKAGGGGGGLACRTLLKHIFWYSLGSPMWKVRVTSVVPQSYCPPVQEEVHNVAELQSYWTPVPEGVHNFAEGRGERQGC